MTTYLIGYHDLFKVHKELPKEMNWVVEVRPKYAELIIQANNMIGQETYETIKENLVNGLKRKKAMKAEIHNLSHILMQEPKSIKPIFSNYSGKSSERNEDLCKQVQEIIKQEDNQLIFIGSYHAYELMNDLNNEKFELKTNHLVFEDLRFSQAEKIPYLKQLLERTIN